MIEIQAQLDYIKLNSHNGEVILDNAQNLYDRWPALDLTVKRRIVEELTQSITIGKEDIEIELGYTPDLLGNTPNSERNVIHALPFSETDEKVVMPYKKAFYENPSKIGDHLCKVRMLRRMFQKDAAQIIGVTEDCFTLWENHKSMPQIQHVPKIIQFLGYNPYSVEGDSLSARIQNHQYKHGLSDKKMGRLVGVHATTVRAWKMGSPPSAKTLVVIEKVLLG